MKKSKPVARAEALKIARYIGCSGAHETDKGWMPCADHATLMRVSQRAEKSLDQILELERKRRRRKKRGANGWENLREGGVISIESLPGVGIVSGKANQDPCWPGYVMAGMKPGKNGKMVPNCVPAETKSERYVRRGDTDVFANPDSARARAKQMGCIGIRRYSTIDGSPAWMPCTNESDYRRSLGTSPQGRIDVAKRQMAQMRRSLQKINKKSDSASSTPAPKKDRIVGSSTNKPGTARSASSGTDIELSKAIVSSLKGSVSRHNARMDELGKPEWSKANLGQLKSVWRRGAGAFSVSHRPGMTRSQWAFARVRAFLWMLEKGKPKKLSYISDRDLLADSHPFKRKGIAQKAILESSFNGVLESKARFIRGRSLGPRIGRATSKIPRPKTDRDGDGDGFKYNPATGRDDAPAARVVEAAAEAVKKRGRKPKASDEQIIELLNQGKNQVSIARELSLTVQTISLRVRKLREEGKLPPISRRTYPAEMRRSVERNVPFTKDEQKNISDLYNANWTINEIAQNMGASVAQTESALMALKRRGIIGERPRPERSKTPDPEIFKFVVERYNDGDSITEIAEAADKSYSTIATLIWRGRQDGQITQKTKKRTKQRVLLEGSERDGKKAPIAAKARKEIISKYREMRKSKGPTQSLRELALEYNTTAFNIRRIVGADLDESFVPKSNRGMRSRIPDEQRKQIQKEYLELRQDASRNQALLFLAEYYGLSEGSVDNIVGYPDIDNQDDGRTVGEKISVSLRAAFDKRRAEREKRVLDLAARGMSDQEIAKTIGLSDLTTGKILKKLRADGKVPPQNYGRARVKKAAELYEQGLPVEEIADRLGYSRSSINSILTRARRDGLITAPKRYRKGTKPNFASLSERDQKIYDLVADGKSQTEIAKELNASISTVRQRLRSMTDAGIIKQSDIKLGQRGRKPTDTVDPEKIVDLIASGNTQAEIAQKLNITPSSVYTAVQKLVKQGVLRESDITRGARGLRKGSSPKRTILEPAKRNKPDLVGSLDDTANRRRELARRLEDIARREKADRFMYRSKIGASYLDEQESKILGMRGATRRFRGIARRRFDRAEFDGDNDGFVTNPMTGRDDLPFAAAGTPDSPKPRRNQRRWSPPPPKTQQRPPRFEEMAGAGSGGAQPPRRPPRATPPDPDRPDEGKYPKTVEMSAGRRWRRDDRAKKIGNTWVSGDEVSNIEIVPNGINIPLRQWNGMPWQMREDIRNFYSGLDDEDKKAMSKMSPSQWMDAARKFAYDRERLAKYSVNNRLSRSFDPTDFQSFLRELDANGMSAEEAADEAQKLTPEGIAERIKQREDELDNFAKATLANWRYMRRKQQENPNYDLADGPRLTDEEFWNHIDYALTQIAAWINEASSGPTARNGRITDSEVDSIINNIIDADLSIASAQDKLAMHRVMNSMLTDNSWLDAWSRNGSINDRERELIEDGTVTGLFENLKSFKDPDEDPDEGFLIEDTWFGDVFSTEYDAPESLPLQPDDPNWRPYAPDGRVPDEEDGFTLSPENQEIQENLMEMARRIMTPPRNIDELRDTMEFFMNSLWSSVNREEGERLKFDQVASPELRAELFGLVKLASQLFDEMESDQLMQMTIPNYANMDPSDQIEKLLELFTPFTIGGLELDFRGHDSLKSMLTVMFNKLSQAKSVGVYDIKKDEPLF